MPGCCPGRASWRASYRGWPRRSVPRECWRGPQGTREASIKSASLPCGDPPPPAPKQILSQVSSSLTLLEPQLHPSRSWPKSTEQDSAPPLEADCWQVAAQPAPAPGSSCPTCTARVLGSGLLQPVHTKGRGARLHPQPCGTSACHSTCWWFRDQEMEAL